MDKIVYIRSLAALLVALFFICVTRTTVFTLLTSANTSEECLAYQVDSEECWERLQGAAKYSTDANITDEKALLNSLSYILKTYTKVFHQPFINYDILDKYSLLITVEGYDDNLKPYLFAGHLDFVTRKKGNFSKTELEANVFGASAIDGKMTVMGLLEALDLHISAQGQPSRSFYLGFSHDSAKGENVGTSKIASLLKSRGLKELEFILTEGAPVLHDILPKVDKPVALIGMTVKSELCLNVSMPTAQRHHSVVEGLAQVINRIESDQLWHGVDYVTSTLLNTVGVYMKFPFNFMFTNQWLFSPLTRYLLIKNLTSSLMCRTTTSVSKAEGSADIKRAWSTINYRIHTTTTPKDVIAHTKQILNDERFSVSVCKDTTVPKKSVPVSPYSEPYFIIKETFNQVFPEVIVAPGVLIGNLDSLSYRRFTDRIYRLSPVYLSQLQTKFLKDDKLKKVFSNNYVLLIKFYSQLIFNMEKTESFDDEL